MCKPLHPMEEVSWCLYAFFVNGTEGSKKKCNSKLKAQKHSVAYDLNRNLGELVL